MNEILSPTSRDARLMLLAAAAGAADAIGYLSFGHIFIANMTGNVVLLGLVIGQGEWPSVPRYGAALLGFILGAAIGAGIVGHAQDRNEWPSRVTIALMTEGAVLLALAVASALMAAVANGAILNAFITCGALAMGIQTTAIRRLQVAGLSTTVITSTIASVIETVIAGPRARLFCLRTIVAFGGRQDRCHRVAALPPRRADSGHPWVWRGGSLRCPAREPTAHNRALAARRTRPARDSRGSWHHEGAAARKANG